MFSAVSPARTISRTTEGFLSQKSHYLEQRILPKKLDFSFRFLTFQVQIQHLLAENNKGEGDKYVHRIVTSVSSTPAPSGKEPPLYKNNFTSI